MSSNRQGNLHISGYFSLSHMYGQCSKDQPCQCKLSTDTEKKEFKGKIWKRNKNGEVDTVMCGRSLVV